MKRDLFDSMKEQMIPSDFLVSSLKYSIKESKKESAAGLILRGATCCLSLCVSALCVFNMTMPAAAEKIPVVGSAFAALNESGREAREAGKTPEILIFEKEKQEPWSIELTAGACDGLDLTFHIRYEDKEGKLDERVRSITLSDASVYYEGMTLRPTSEAPILYETEDGTFSGEARFNASVISGLLENTQEIEFTLHFSTVFGYWDSVADEGGEAFKYNGAFVSAGKAYVDLSKMTVEYVGAEKDGMSLEYIITGEDRTDVLFKIDGSVEYADCFVVGTESETPDCVTMNPSVGEDGSRTYCATFSGGVKSEKGEESVKDDKNESVYISPGDVVFYSTATGESYYLDREEEKP